jgi:hypothetical protein
MPKVDSLVPPAADQTPDGGELRQLKLTIAALRQALEDSTATPDELSQTIRAECEIAQHKST